MAEKRETPSDGDKKTTEDKHGITAMDRIPMNNIGSVIATVLVIGTVIALTMHKMRGTGMKSGPISSINVTTLLPISTTTWTVVETHGRNFGNDAVIVNGVELVYIVAINSPEGRTFELSSIKGRADYGPWDKINKVYFRLKSGQGVNKASVPFRFKD